MSKNIQFNATSFKPNRDKLSKYYNATHELVETIEKLNDKIRNVEGSLASLKDTEDSDNALIDAEDVKRTITTLETRLEKLNKDVTTAKSKAKKAQAEALALVTDDLYKGYVEDENFAEVVATWFQSIGLPDATPEGCDDYTRYVGTHSKKSTKKAKRTTGRISAGQPRKSFEVLWINALCDDLLDAKVINPYKYTYTPESMKKKDEKKSK